MLLIFYLINFYNQEKNINVGDIIIYEPPIDESNKIGVYDWNNKYSTLKDTEIRTIKNTDPDFQTTKWRVLNIKNNIIEVVPYSINQGKVAIEGAEGYNNSVFLLNEICKSLYSNNSLGITARSINIEDFENIIKFLGNEKNFNAVKEKTVGYGKKSSREFIYDKTWYPSIYEQEKNSMIDGVTNNRQNALEFSEGLDEVITDGIKKQSKISIWPYQTYYGTNNYETTSNLLLNEDYKYSEILMPNGNTTNYWIASRCIGYGDDGVHYDLRRMNNGFLRAFRLYTSSDVSRKDEHEIFPVITINKDLLKKIAANTYEVIK